MTPHVGTHLWFSNLAETEGTSAFLVVAGHSRPIILGSQSSGWRRPTFLGGPFHRHLCQGEEDPTKECGEHREGSTGHKGTQAHPHRVPGLAVAGRAF